VYNYRRHATERSGDVGGGRAVKKVAKTTTKAMSISPGRRDAKTTSFDEILTLIESVRERKIENAEWGDGVVDELARSPGVAEYRKNETQIKACTVGARNVK
jgi:hypothetical protein